MANYIIPELARGRNKVPAYTPLVVPEVSDAPWAATSMEHAADVARRRVCARQAKRVGDPQSIPMQAWLLYQLRFLAAEDLAGDWLGFGGLASQLNLLSIVMNISIAGSASAALPYGRLACEFLAERARSWREVDGPNFPGEFLSVGNPPSKLRAVIGHPRATAAPKVHLAKERLKQKNSEPAAKAALAAANGSPRRAKHPWRYDKNRDARKSQPLSIAFPLSA